MDESPLATPRSLIDISMVPYLAEGRCTRWFQALLPTEVQVVSVENAPREAHALAHAVILFQPEHP